jgi:DNA-binding NarL/FixJ family response regulator
MTDELSFWEGQLRGNREARGEGPLPPAPGQYSLPELPKTVKQRGMSVCLCAAHPLALAELQESLSEPRFRVLARRLETDGSAPLSVRLPRAAAYVLDLPPHRQAAEMLVSRILQRSPRARVVVVGERFDDATAFALLRSGVKGLVRYAEARESLGRVLDALSADGYWVPRAMLSRFVEHALGGASRMRRPQGGVELSRRERQVLGMIHENLSNKEIASHLHISPRTAKFHVSNLLAKHGVKRRAELILLRFARGQRD